jgi:sugar lactone lactonase YvrE
MWPSGSTNPTRNFTGNLSSPYALFVMANGDIYVGNGKNDQVVKWAINATNSILVMNVTSTCFSLFIDINDTLYCSLEDQHEVVKTSLNNNSTNTTILVAAGTGWAGSTSTMLNSPKGIFVDTSFNLYVADCNNNRIQLFCFGQSNATTIALNGSSGTITLDCPTGIILDANDYLFISDSNNHRIVGSGPDGFRCVVACSGTSGSTSTQLKYPQNLAFDSFGNLFVVDQNNSRIQQFIMEITYCGE